MKSILSARELHVQLVTHSEHLSMLGAIPPTGIMKGDFFRGEICNFGTSKNGYNTYNVYV